jgi:hypothetical protein
MPHAPDELGVEIAVADQLLDPFEPLGVGGALRRRVNAPSAFPHAQVWKQQQPHFLKLPRAPASPATHPAQHDRDALRPEQSSVVILLDDRVAADLLSGPTDPLGS